MFEFSDLVSQDYSQRENYFLALMLALASKLPDERVKADLQNKRGVQWIWEGAVELSILCPSPQ